MTQKTPYEIRKDLLHIAYSILDRNCVNIVNEGSDKPASIHPIKFTTEDIIAEAEKLNRFISMERPSQRHGKD